MEFPIVVKKDKELGRYFVASRDIEAGELVMVEDLMLCCPRDENDDKEISTEESDIPLCLGCMTQMTSNPKNRCFNCQLPICDSFCKLKHYHEDNECKLFAKLPADVKLNFPLMNKTIMVMRCLLLKDNNPENFEYLMTFEHHSDLRIKLGHTEDDGQVIKNILENFEELKTDKEEIVKIIGIICTNAFNWEKTVSFKTRRMPLVLFKKTTLFSHSCLPNLKWTLNSKFQMMIRATVPISSGQLTSISYCVDDMIVGTMKRRKLIENQGLFYCKCQRCIDPTEAGTNLSAVKCQCCLTGYLLPLDPLNVKSLWKCGKCSGSEEWLRINRLLTAIEEEISLTYKELIATKVELKEYDLSMRFTLLLKNLEKSFQKLERLYEKYNGKILHPNHWILQEISRKFVSCYEFFYSEIPLDEYHLDRFAWHCKNLLRVADVIIPGLNYNRAILQYYLSKVLMQKLELIQSKLEEDDSNKSNNVQIKKLDTEIDKFQADALLFFRNYLDQI